MAPFHVIPVHFQGLNDGVSRSGWRTPKRPPPQAVSPRNHLDQANHQGQTETEIVRLPRFARRIATPTTPLQSPTKTCSPTDSSG